MLRQRTRTLQAMLAASDAAATLLAFLAAYYGAGVLLTRWLGLLEVLPVHRYVWMLGVAVPLWWILLAAFGGYDLSPLQWRRDLLARMTWPTLLVILSLGAMAFYSKELQYARRVIGAFALANILFVLLGRLLLLAVASRRHAAGQRRMLIIGTGESALAFGEAIRRRGWGLQLVGYVELGPGPAPREAEPLLGDVNQLRQILDASSVDDAVLADPASTLAMARQAIAVCEEVGVCIHIPSLFFDARLSRPHVETFHHTPMLTFSTAPYSPIALGVKRGMDVVGAALMLIPGSVVMGLLAVGIKLTSPGPVIFRQRRSGLYGREFTMYKLRSMVADAEQRRAELEARNEMTGPAFKMEHDPRVTRLGRFMRRHSLDELPQLWNVLRGDMSLIGPRPPLPDEVRLYERWQRRRLSMRPGLTCTWQITDRNRATFEKWMEYDLAYIDEWSLWLDFKIALRTVPVVFRGTNV